MIKKIEFIYNNTIQSATITTWLSYLSKSLNFFIVLPLLLKEFNASDVSKWYSFLAIISWLSVIESGFSFSFSRAVSYSKVNFKLIGIIKNDDVEYCTSLYFLLKRYFTQIAIIVLVLSFGIFYFFGLFRLEYIPINIIFLLFLSISLSISSFGNLFLCILNGTNNIHTLKLWETIFNVFISISNITAFLLYPNVYVLIFINQIWSIINVIRNYFLVRKVFPFHNYKFYNVQKSHAIKEKFLLEAIKSVFGVLMSMGVFSFFSIFYSFRFKNEPNLLASYLLGFNLIQNIKNISQAPFYGKIPILNTLFAKNDFINLIKVAAKGMKYSHITYLLLLILIGFSGPLIFKSIGSNVVFPKFDIWFILGFGFFLERYGAMYLQLFSVSNIIIWHKLNGITGFAIILISFLILKKFGILSFPISLLFAYLFIYTPISILRVIKYYNIGYIEFEKIVWKR